MMNNFDYQKMLLDLMDQGYELLTETERFAHQLRWRFRRAHELTGRSSWAGARCRTFNSWADVFWEELWPETWPASSFSRWRILSECMKQSPPPEPLLPDIPLVLGLDECFEHCLRYGVDPGRGEPANRLVEWRRSLWGPFQERMAGLGLFHPACLPERLCRYLSDHTEVIPSKAAVVGFEFAGYWERTLLEMLAGRTGGVMLPLPAVEMKPRALVYADPEQEVFGLLDEIIASTQRFPLHDLAVVLLDSTGYAPLVAKHFKDVFGLPLEGENSAYNLVSGNTLSEHSLYRAAVLPLDFCIREENRLPFFSLIRSPYYGYLAPWNRTLTQWDWKWKEKGIERGLKTLLESLPETDKIILPRGGNELTEAFAPLLRTRRTVSSWLENLRLFWKQMGFPVLANERDQVAWQRLNELLDRFGVEFGDNLTDAANLSAWLNAGAERLHVELSGYEDAGIQVIGGLELRGLSFKRAYVPGFLAGVIPQQPRSFPLLSGRERQRIQGGDVESQYLFARHLLGQILASSDEVVLSRPMMTSGGDPCVPSPFWPGEDEKIMESAIPWRHDMPALQRARWVADGVRGFAVQKERESISTRCADEGPTGNKGDNGGRTADLYHVKNLRFPGQISVSALESLLCCPSRFFLQEILRLENLLEPVRGLDPPTRGRQIHELLLLFGKRLLSDPHGFELPLEELLIVLNDCIPEAAKNEASAHCWEVEVRRLLGNRDGMPGLLSEWLGEEHSLFLQGWRWISLEADFSGLRLRDCPVQLRGRLDRLDFHPEHGCICWDYKTGNVPRQSQVTDELKFPQLPAYLLAIRRALIGGSVDPSVSLAAGYIALKSVRHLKHVVMVESNEKVDSLLARWEAAAAEALNEAFAGKMTPQWARDSCESSCPFDCLCGSMLFDGEASTGGGTVVGGLMHCLPG